MSNEDHGSDDATAFECAIDRVIDASAETNTVVVGNRPVTDRVHLMTFRILFRLLPASPMQPAENFKKPTAFRFDFGQQPAVLMLSTLLVDCTH